MLARNNRLSKNMEIKKVLSKGRAFFNPFFTLKFIIQPNGRCRFTVVVSTKVSKLAVRRNRIKRIVREKFKLISSQLPSGDYLLICKPSVNTIEESKFLQSLEEVFKKVMNYGHH
jgi:ribonuclease P protein component